MGYIVVPLLLNYLMENVSNGDWRQAILIYSLIVAAVFFTAALTLRPIEIDPPTIEEMLDIEDVLISSQSQLHYPSRSRNASKAYKSVLEPITETEPLNIETKTTDVNVSFTFHHVVYTFIVHLGLITQDCLLHYCKPRSVFA